MKYQKIVLPLCILSSILFVRTKIHHISTEVTKSTGKYQPSEWFHLQRAHPYADIPYEKYITAVSGKRYMSKETIFDRQWQPAGPFNIGGRITALDVDPANPAIIYAGAAAGGVFKTTDAGTSWRPLTDQWQSLSVGALVLDPNNSAIVYCGTGEANISTDSYAGFGLLKSTDGGATWQNSGLDSVRHIAEIEIRKSNSKNIYVAASGGLYSKSPHRGIYRSMNGGVDWYKVLYRNDSTSAIDVAIDPSDTSIVYAAMWERLRGPTFRKAAGLGSAMYRSTDGGWTWSQMTAGLPVADAKTGRISIAVAPSNPAYVYALYKSASTANGSTNGFYGFYRSTNKGINWNRMPDGPLSSSFSTFGWYFGQLTVDPVNHLKVYLGEVDLFRTIDGGTTWQNITNSYSGTWQDQHPDQHALWINPLNTTQLVNGNDGGIYISNNDGASWIKKYDLPVSQFYAGCVDPNNAGRLFGGTQDNGTIGTTTGGMTDWSEFLGGDGFVCHVDYSDANIIYAESQNGGIARTTDGGASFYTIRTGLDMTRTNWSTPYIIDPVNPQNLYLGSYKLYKTTNRGTLWTAISPDLTRGANGRLGTITAISAGIHSATQQRVLYVATDDAKISVSTNDGGSWTDRTGTLLRRYMTDVLADQRDPAIAYLTLSGYNLDQPMPHVYKTTDYGTNWISISGNLPDVPVNSIVIDYDYPSVLYIGTDLGVFYTTNGGGQWGVLGTGLPNSPVFDIYPHRQSKTLFAATHGRSIYKINLAGISSIADENVSGSANDFILSQNYPNPFNPATTVKIKLSQEMSLRFDLLNAAGQLVHPLGERRCPAGIETFTVNAENLSSGVYFLRVGSAATSRTIKLLLMK